MANAKENCSSGIWTALQRIFFLHSSTYFAWCANFTNNCLQKRTQFKMDQPFSPHNYQIGTNCANLTLRGLMNSYYSLANRVISLLKLLLSSTGQQLRTTKLVFCVSSSSRVVIISLPSFSVLIICGCQKRCEDFSTIYRNQMSGKNDLERSDIKNGSDLWKRNLDISVMPFTFHNNILMNVVMIQWFRTMGWCNTIQWNWWSKCVIKTEIYIHSLAYW